jgi:phosphoribosylformylglycinamidine synthase I
MEDVVALRVGVVVFPGSNCDHDTLYAFGGVFGMKSYEIWHADTDLRKPDMVVIPGGFSYGDYLRCGAIARFSPVMEEVIRFAKAGGAVLGICNGFQILCEAGLLPGALLRNRRLTFLGRDVHLRVEQTDTPFTCCCEKQQVLRLPIAHGDGNYFADEPTLDRLESEGCVVFRYCSPAGELDEAHNFNGAARFIAGICSENRRVVGLMPHPERACDPELDGKSDGQAILRSAANWPVPV